jgi:hypothetical protein
MATALALTVLFGVIGWTLKSFVWNASETPKTATDYGRKLSGYFLFATTLISSHNFIRKEFDEAVIATIVTMLMFSLTGFVIGFVYGSIASSGDSSENQDSKIYPPAQFSTAETKIHTATPLTTKNPDKETQKLEMNNPVNVDEEAVWADALAELEGENRKPGIWAKAFSESNGDVNQAEALYLKIRFNEISKIRAVAMPTHPSVTVQVPVPVPVPKQPPNQFSKAEETSKQRRRRLTNVVRSIVRYEDAIALLEDSGYQIKVRPSGFLSPTEYEIWDSMAETMIFKAISKGLVVQFVREKFDTE